MAKGNNKIFGLIVLIAVIFLTGRAWINNGGLESFTESTDFNRLIGDPIVEARSYQGQEVYMTEISPEAGDEYIYFSLKRVDQKNIIFFEVENKIGSLVPLIAYITPTGRLFVGTSLCEPCGGRRLHLKDDTVVCNRCNTTYNIENRVGIRGTAACMEYPPVAVDYRIIDDQIKIPIREIKYWKPRL
ncbi:Fe-S-containing protein [Natroniella sp. ANB-PHB2]|uniref:Fe-S-containing protein n=1 Tax=Natroniella sp. ANB-PHB2 TaxID=3384444 RepID=UPI0038D4879E